MPGYTGSAAQTAGTVVYNSTDEAGWGVAGASQYGELLYLIDNCQDLDETKFVYLQFEVKTVGDGYYVLDLDSDGMEAITGGAPQFLGSEGGWDKYAVQWEIVPQPAGETVSFEMYTTVGGEVWLQNVLVSTHCTPEPVTLSLLAIGALAMVRRRRPAGMCRRIG